MPRHRLIRLALFVLPLALALAAVAAAWTATHRQVTPIALVPGFGYDLAPLAFNREVFDDYGKWLAESGVPREHVYVIDYPYRADLDTIRDVISRELEAILAKYPPGTRIDVVGHSMGALAGLYGVMEGGLAGRVRKFVSLAGITQGWNGDLCKRLGVCGKAQAQIVPFRSPFIRDFLSRHDREIARLEKCSLYSPDDGMVSPYDAGRLDGGTNVELKGATHLDMIWKKEVFETMREKCYGGRFR